MTDKMQAPQAVAWGAWEVAGAEGLELSTSGFGDRRSSQLSYAPRRDRNEMVLRTLISVSQLLTAPYRWLRLMQVSVGDGCHHAGAHRPATLTDGETQALIHRDRRDQRHVHRDVVAGHHHFHAIG